MEQLNARYPDFYREVMHSPHVVRLLPALAAHHLETFEHSIRVSVYSSLAGYDLDLDYRRLVAIARAGALHDIGKLRIPVGILSKNGSLTQKERAVVEKHPIYGFEILADFKLVRDVVVAVHEYQRNPYPRSALERRNAPRGDRRTMGLRSSALAQIVAAADHYDALASRRDYKEPFAKQDIETLLREQLAVEPRYIEAVLRVA